MGAGLRPRAKAMEQPPDPVAGAPALDSTKDSRGEGALNGLEALLDHRVVADIKYLAAPVWTNNPARLINPYRKV